MKIEKILNLPVLGLILSLVACSSGPQVAKNSSSHANRGIAQEQDHGGSTGNHAKSLDDTRSSFEEATEALRTQLGNGYVGTGSLRPDHTVNPCRVTVTYESDLTTLTIMGDGFDRKKQTVPLTLHQYIRNPIAKGNALTLQGNPEDKVNTSLGMTTRERNAGKSDNRDLSILRNPNGSSEVLLVYSSNYRIDQDPNGKTSVTCYFPKN